MKTLAKTFFRLAQLADRDEVAALSARATASFGKTDAGAQNTSGRTSAPKGSRIPTFSTPGVNEYLERHPLEVWRFTGAPKG